MNALQPCFAIFNHFMHLVLKGTLPSVDKMHSYLLLKKMQIKLHENMLQCSVKDEKMVPIPAKNAKNSNSPSHLYKCLHYVFIQLWL